MTLFKKIAAVAGIMALIATLSTGIATAQVLNGLTNDAQITGPDTSVTQDANGTSVGGVGTDTQLRLGFAANTTGRVPVFVFQLPSLGNIANPFTTASFTSTLFSQGVDQSPTNYNGDLYGLGVRASATVLTTDYFVGANDKHFRRIKSDYKSFVSLSKTVEYSQTLFCENAYHGRDVFAG